MDMVKRNLGFIVIFLFVLVAAGVVLGVASRYSRQVRQSRTAFEDHRRYFEDLARRTPGVSALSLRQAQENLQIAQTELVRLQSKLNERSRLPTRTMDGVQAKDYLVAEVRRLNSELSRRNVAVGQNATGFSFRSVIQATGLPEPTHEVPALVRQMQVVGRLVETVAESGVSELVSLARPAGIRQIRKDDYTVIRLNMEVRGPLASIKRLINALHTDEQYYFSVPYMQWQVETPDRVATADRPQTIRRTVPERRRPPMIEDEWRFEGGEELARPERLPREQRRVAFADVMTVSLPVHFIEFKPEEQQE